MVHEKKKKERIDRSEQVVDWIPHGSKGIYVLGNCLMEYLPSGLRFIKVRSFTCLSQCSEKKNIHMKVFPYMGAKEPKPDPKESS